MQITLKWLLGLTSLIMVLQYNTCTQVENLNDRLSSIEETISNIPYRQPHISEELIAGELYRLQTDRTKKDNAKEEAERLRIEGPPSFKLQGVGHNLPDAHMSFTYFTLEKSGTATDLKATVSPPLQIFDSRTDRSTNRETLQTVGLHDFYHNEPNSFNSNHKIYVRTANKEQLPDLFSVIITYLDFHGNEGEKEFIIKIDGNERIIEEQSKTPNGP